MLSSSGAGGLEIVNKKGEVDTMGWSRVSASRRRAKSRKRADRAEISSPTPDLSTLGGTACLTLLV